MSKELTPLEALWKLYTYDDLKSRNPIAYLLEQENLSKYYKTIEKALKRLEIIDRLNEKNCEETQNKLKALEIINLTNADIVELKRSIDVQQYNSNHFSTSIDLVPETFNLLKEVLK